MTGEPMNSVLLSRHVIRVACHEAIKAILLMDLISVTSSEPICRRVKNKVVRCTDIP